MPRQVGDITQPKAYARFAGLNYLIIFALAIFANFFILSDAIVSGDAAATAKNVIEHESQFRLAATCFFVVMLADVFIAWALYLILKPVDPAISLLSMLFRLTYTVAQIGVILNLSKALQLVELGQVADAAGALNNPFFIHFFASAHDVEFKLTLIFFGVHLIVLGWLFMRANFFPFLIGALVAIAGVGYIIDGFAELLWNGYGPFGSLGLYTVVLPALIGEGALMAWLLVRGLNQQKWLDAAQ